MKQFSKKKNIIFGLILPYFAIAISLVSSFFLTPIVLDNIGEKNYGLLSFCNSITIWLSVISTSLGASYAFFASKDIKEFGDEKRVNAIFFRMLLFIGISVFIFLAIVVSTLVLLGIKVGNYSQDDSNLIYLLLIISGLHIAVTICFSIFTLFSNYKNSFAFVQGLQIVLSLLTFGLTLLVALTIKSIVFVALVSLLSSILSGVVTAIYAIKIRGMTFSGTSENKNMRSELKPIIIYSSVVLISTIIYNLDSNLDKTLLGLMISAESVTMYSLSLTFISKGGVLVSSFTNVYRPTIFQLCSNGDTEGTNKLFLRISKAQTIMVLLIIGGYISCGYHFTISWIGIRRIDVFYYSLALLVSQVVPWSTSSSSEVWHAKNLHRIPTICNIISIIINLILSISLIIFMDPSMAIWGCIIGTLFPRVLFSYIVQPILASRYLKLPMFRYYKNVLKDIIIVIFAIAPCVAFSMFLNGCQLHSFIKALIEGIAFVGVYVLLIYIFERETIKDVFGMIFKHK